MDYLKSLESKLDSSDFNAEREALPNEIYLVPESDGQIGYYWAWCDVPQPTPEHIPEEAVKYIKVKA